jgi:hypothetical protein
VRVALNTAQTYTSGGAWERRAPHNLTGMKRRIYRTVGTNTDYKLVTEQAASSTVFNDTVASTALGSSPTVSLGSFTPPKNGHSLVSLANGALAMLAGNELCISEQYKPYSWPLANRYAFAGLGVALVAGGQLADRADRCGSGGGDSHGARGDEPCVPGGRAGAVHVQDRRGGCGQRGALSEQ